MKAKSQLPQQDHIPIRQSVDEILLDYGRYEPLELLQREGRLMYADYESWRNGETDSLDELLMGDVSAICELLEVAANYARELKLQPEQLSYAGWGHGSGKSLDIHSNQQLAQLITAQWMKAQDVPQLDLFMDSPGTSLSNGLQEALANRNPIKARQLLEKLYDVDAAHAELSLLETLVLAQENASLPVNDVNEELRKLQHEVLPAGLEILNNRLADYAAPLWRRLSTALDEYSFNPQLPELHRSYTSEQGRDWLDTRNAIEKTENWYAQPILLARQIRCCSQLGDETTSQLSCFRLCWQFPKEARQLMDEYPSSLMRAEWRRFSEQDELEISAFPAWLMIRFPALHLSLPENVDGINSGIYLDYQLAHQLQQLRGSKLDEQQIHLRQKFQATSPGLFPYFLARQPH